MFRQRHGIGDATIPFTGGTARRLVTGLSTVDTVFFLTKYSIYPIFFLTRLLQSKSVVRATWVRSGLPFPESKVAFKHQLKRGTDDGRKAA
jgi:hypothetical protein